jgi:hypothetical protein
LTKIGELLRERAGSLFFKNGQTQGSMTRKRGPYYRETHFIASYVGVLAIATSPLEWP